MNSKIKQIKSTDLELKINLQFEEIKMLRSDMLQTRADLQRTFVYTFALATIVATFISRLSTFEDKILLSALLLITSILFFMLSISYIGNMRHYLNIARYIEVKCKELDELFTEIEDNIKLPEILNWEIWNRDFYKKFLSKTVFAITWGVQPVFPVFFGTLAILAAFIIHDFNLSNAFCQVWSNWILKLLFIITLVILLSIFISLLIALAELNKDIAIAKMYLKYNKIKRKGIITSKD